MRAWFTIIFALAALQRQTPQVVPLDADLCKCSIAVTVKRIGTGEPIPDVELELRVAGLAPFGGESLPVYRGGPLSVRTTASGRAEFRDLAEGLYTVLAQRPDDFYFVGSASAKTVQSSVYVGPREQPVQQVSFTMMTGGSISGRVQDAKHQPFRIAVSAYRVEYHDGQRSLVPAGVAEETDELGDYQLPGLAEGQYFIRTVSPLPQQNQTYFPGVLGPASAVSVAVREGQNLAGIDFSIPAPAGVTISGIVINPFPGGDTQPDGKLLRAISSLYLVPRNTGFYFDFPQPIPNVATGRSNAANGTELPFEIRNVPPGSYDLYPLFVDTATDAHVNHYMSPTRVEVGTEDIRNVIATIRKGTALTVRASRDSAASLPISSRIESSILGVNLIPKESQPAQFLSGRNDVGVSVKPGAEVVIPELMDGRYAVSVVLSGFSPNEYVSDIRHGVKSVFDDGFISFSKDAADPLEVIMRSGGGTIQGKLDTNGQNKIQPHVTVSLIPDPPRRQNLLLYKTVSIATDGNGIFIFNGVAPGTYKLFAWESIPAGAQHNAEFITDYETRGVSVTVSAGVTLTNIEIPLIPGI